jgi:hypothetical protein
MPMDSISMCSITLYMSNADVGSSFEVAVRLSYDIMASF